MSTGLKIETLKSVCSHPKGTFQDSEEFKSALKCSRRQPSSSWALYSVTLGPVDGKTEKLFERSQELIPKHSIKILKVQNPFLFSTRRSQDEQKLTTAMELYAKSLDDPV